MNLYTILSLFQNLVICYAGTTRVTVEVNTTVPVQNVGPNFVSVALEAGIFREKQKVKDNFKFRYLLSLD